VTDEYGAETPVDDDFAAMLGALDGVIGRRKLARAIGVKPSELDLIAIGHAPSPQAAKRLRSLYALAQRAEGDPQVLARSLAASSDGELLVPLSLVPRMKTYLIAFVVVDALIFGAVMIVFVLRG
jgi:hypothetical protein